MRYSQIGRRSHARLQCLLLLPAVVAWLVMSGPPAAADDPAAVTAAEAAIAAVHQAIEEGRPTEAGLSLADAGRAMDAVADLGRAVSPEVIRRLAAECETLAFELRFDAISVKGLPDTQELLRRRAEQIRSTPSRKSPPPMAAAVPAGPSFAQQIAPLLVRSCGRCHVTGSRGDFSMETYNALAASGMVVPGDGPGSRLVEVIQTGDMPRGGGQLAAGEFAALVAWINAGALFDGADPAVSLADVRPAIAMADGAADEPAAMPEQTIGPGEVPFSSAVAGILVENCQRCHGGRNASADFSVDTFADLADSGVIEPGKGAESLLVRKLRGVNIDGQRMPRGRPPLPDDQIAVIQQWIDEGGRLDMLEPAAELTRIASEGRSRNLSHEELRNVRFEAAEPLWRRGIVDEEGTLERREDLCVVGNLEGARLSSATEAAVEVEQQILRLLKLNAPLTKGGMAVFLFARGYDYSNFWQNVMGRERPRGLMGHADVSGDVVYAAVAVDGDAENVRLQLAAELTSAAFKSRRAPSWFAEAAGRVVARQLAPDAALIANWDDAERLAGSTPLPNAEQFFSASLSSEQVAVAAAMFAAVDRDGRRLVGLLSRLDKGDDFDQAFRQTYRMVPSQMLLTWMSKGR
jgi:mono/diheme cytochrome c family protein